MDNKYYQSRHFLKLLHRYEKSVSEGHVPYLEADELTDIAEYYMTGKQDAKANQAIQAAIDMHPDSIDPQIFLARQKMFYGQLEEARNIIDAITEQDDCEIIYIRAELLIKEDRAHEASDYLLEQKEVMQDSLDNYLYDCTSIFMDYDQWEFAKEWLDYLRISFPNHPKLSIMEAEIRMGLDDYEGALPMLQKIVDDDPYNSEAWNLLAETYNELENYAEAQDAAEYSLAINPQDSNAMLMKANAYMHCSQMKEAIEVYNQYLETQPEDPSVLISLAICYSGVERYEDVLPVLERAEKYAREQPNGKADLPQIYQIRAYALSNLDRTSEALVATKEARKYIDESEMWRIDMSEAEIYLHDGQTKLAEKTFMKVMENTTEKGETLFNIALAFHSSGYYDVAIEVLQLVWTYYGTNEGKFVVPYLANCYMHKNDMDNFLKYIRVAYFCNRDITQYLFGDRFPGIPPEEYYAYAYKEIHGVFPENPDL